MDRMKRIDEQVSAAQREPGGDAALAEAKNHVGFKRAGETSLGQPGRQFGEEFLVHRAIIQAPACQVRRRICRSIRMSAHHSGCMAKE